MKISLNTHIRLDNLVNSNGYGYATERMVASLNNLGYEVTINDPTADVGIVFNQPPHAKWYGDQYRIMYHPWESTLLKDGWAELMNEADEIWTPSPVIADWYTKFSGITKPVYVYEHGVDTIWSEVERKVDGPMKFLHIGAEASRKGARETMHNFRQAFGRSTDVELTLKILSKGWQIGAISNITIVNKDLGVNELVNMYHENHVYVYPSWGEGFGLTPLQAMATGMPTITVPGWAPYKDYLDPKLSLRSSFWKTQWPTLHPGNMLKPNEGDLIEAYRHAYNNYDEVNKFAHSQVEALRAHYDWDRLTKESFEALAGRLKNL